MTKRISKRVIAGISLAQFEEALSQYAGSEAREAEIFAKLDAEMTKIKEKYSDELGYLQEKKNAAQEVLETYCREQKEILFCKRRSMHTVYGSLGFRLGNPRLKTLRGNTWSMVLERLKKQLPEYVRLNEEPAKDLLLADRNKENVAPFLRDLGLQVVQDELFFIEMKKAQA
ncbi:MAG: host-nuclease inhibitor Gam family protein [Bacteroidetes bacterium]|nr:host-nuclease inhibitor Gam family protein [Bacteroidota bacterium]